MDYKISFDPCTYLLNDLDCFSTVFENICEAKNKKLEGIGIVVRGHTHNFDKTEKIINSVLNISNEVQGIKILKGIESSIISLGRSDMDVSGDALKRPDFSIVSYYQSSFPNFTPDGEKILQTIENCLISYGINGIGQFAFGKSNVNFRNLILFCKEHNKFIELSNDKIKNNQVSASDVRKILILCKDLNVPVIISSGARLFNDVGNFECILPILKDVDFPKSLILNLDLDKFVAFKIKFDKK